MPYDGSAGHGDGTGRKQADFEKILGLELRVAREVQHNHTWASPVFHFVDLTAGPGEVNGADGSPIVAANLLATDGAPWQGLFCERDPVSFARLQRRRAELPAEIASRILMFPVDHQNAITGIVKGIRKRSGELKAFGLVYADPNGTLIDEEIQTIRAICAAHPMLDVLLHLSATTIKRCKSVFGYPSLVERLAGIGKSRLLIREPCTHHQWTFVLATDWKGFPEWKAIEFHVSTSPQGAAILERLDLSDREMKAKNQERKQMALW